eukprot:scpid110542/ scgid27531/ 
MKSSTRHARPRCAALHLQTLGCDMVQGAHLSEATGFHCSRTLGIPNTNRSTLHPSTATVASKDTAVRYPRDYPPLPNAYASPHYPTELKWGSGSRGKRDTDLDSQA